MAQVTVAILIFLLGYCVVPTPATLCNGASRGYSYDWTCPSDQDCCYDRTGCCEEDRDEEESRASYWYAWFLISLLVLMCVCACIGCGGYKRYQRNHYYVRRLDYPPPRATVVTRVVPQPQTQYRAAAAAPAANKPYSDYRIPNDPPPPYTPSVPPPYYS